MKRECQGNGYRHLMLEQREQISIGLALGHSCRAIARQLARAPSSVWREVRRHSDAQRPYRAAWAQAQCQDTRARSGRPRKLDLQATAATHALSAYVREKLLSGWSAAQIAARLKHEHPQDKAWQVSAPTIYNAIYVLPRNALRRALLEQGLRLGPAPVRPSTKAPGAADKPRIAPAQQIHARPQEAASREVPGHWEGDLIMGAANRTQVGVLLERVSRRVVLARLPDKRAASVCAAFAAALRQVPTQLRKTLTYDQGSEMAAHRQLSDMTGVAVYFADAHSPWQKGAIENANGLLRQYLPKGTDLGHYTQDQLELIAQRLNDRPRICHNGLTPNEVYAAMLAKLSVAGDS